MPRPWYEYLASVRQSPDGTVTREYLFPGEESPSPDADQLVEDFGTLHKQIVEKYGEQQEELPYDEWVIWRGLNARVSALPLPEQRYVWRRLSGENRES